ncbi:MAG: dipeptidyl aminopeptidase/acylaminoacyl peptidase [Gammaproteobacteria bacterium]|jgi:dipeptidyl aminopeptidase/acylaminoacyl peptidase
MNKRAKVFGVLLLMLGLPVSAETNAKTHLQLSDINLLRDVSEPEISPDGKWVSYTVTSVDTKTDEDNTDIWMASWDGKENIEVLNTAASEYRPRWSPDNRYLTFLSNRSDKEKEEDQIWLLDRRGGEAKQLTTLPGGISDYAWSPDAKKLLVVGTVGSSTEEIDPKKPKPIVVDRFYFKEDESGYLGNERSRIYLFDLESREAHLLTDGDYDEYQPVWSPDGKQIAFTSKRSENFDRNNDWNIYIMPAQPGAKIDLLTHNPGADGDPSFEGWSLSAWHPKGKKIAVLAGGKPELTWYAMQQLALVNVEDKHVQLPTVKLDRNTYAPRWSADGQHLYFLIEDDFSVQLASIELKTGKIKYITKPGLTVYAFDIDKRGRLVILYTSPEHPNEVAVVENNSLRNLSNQNSWLNDRHLVKTERIAFSSNADETRVHALLLKPYDYSIAKKYPTIMRLHGGPVSQHQLEFNFDWQLFAANGYVVVAPNPRGSTGRGAAYQQAPIADWGNLDVHDVIGSIDYLIKGGIADETRLGVGGWSYGAMLTNYTIATDQRFRAATSGAGVSNMLAGYGTDMYVRDWEIELGLPWSNLEKWLKISYPYYQANKITTPTLFLCGELDFNVPLIHSEQMYQALKRLNVPTKLIIYPEQYHSFSRPSFREDVLQRYLEWYDAYLK